MEEQLKVNYDGEDVNTLPTDFEQLCEEQRKELNAMYEQVNTYTKHVKNLSQRCDILEKIAQNALATVSLIEQQIALLNKTLEYINTTNTGGQNE